ncbi:PEP-CTERM sorting domain-containing protein [Paludisphaera rhizosphaerae]|uniref:PEP-CTERM sorting domain-containing protein n=1 Tax=Paludisphaera rhizosphaerae TaxID=2711216 RepID=UPI0013ED97B9|nr:PEP-CTERM sorting domain-containing protein [Paludisphaera rhizosphaerae]
MAAGLAALLISSSVQGSPLSYTVTDLGTQPISFTPSAAPTRTATQPPLAMYAPIWDQMTHGNPAYAYNFITTSVANAGGLTAYIESVGVDGHETGSAAAGLYVARQDASGAWHVLNEIGSSTSDHGYGSRPNGGLYIGGINALDQVLAGWIPQGYSSHGYDYWYTSKVWVYDEKTNTTLDMSNVLGPGWGAIRTGGIDDDGRILLSAYSESSNLTEQHEFLLTPTDLSAAPVPEPSTFLVLALGAGAFAIRRSRRVG